MTQRVLQDFNIKKKKVLPPPPPLPREEIPPRLRENRHEKIREKRSPRYGLWVLAAASIIILFFAISSIFSSAKITINPKTKDFVLSQALSATKKTESGVLSYDLVTLSGEESKQVTAGAEQEYLIYAGGTVLIYNAYTSAKQTFPMGTKLEGSNGKIYKIDTKIIVPGMAKNGTPGKVSVGISAVSPGEEYNSGPIDFKIVSLKGTRKYAKIYGRSVEEIGGGLSGKSRQVSKADREKAAAELTEALSTKLFQKAKDQTPKDFVLFSDANYVSTEDPIIGGVGEDGMAKVSVKGTFYGVLFNQKDLTRKITDSLLDDASKSDDVYIPNLAGLKITLENKNEMLFTDATDINFGLSGPMKIVWRVDAGKIIASVLGKSKSEFSQILSKYSNIDSANLSIKPAWKSSIPDKSKKIQITINYP